MNNFRDITYDVLKKAKIGKDGREKVWVNEEIEKMVKNFLEHVEK